MLAGVIGFLHRDESARILDTDPATGWHLIECPIGLDGTLPCWVSGSMLYSDIRQENSAPVQQINRLLSDVTSNVEELKFGEVYWIKLEGEEAVTLYLAPPRRTPDGIVPGLNEE